MSKSRKFVKDNALNSFPTPHDNQTIVQVTELRGGNICEVVNPAGTKLLARIPAKFNKVIWIGRCDFLIIEPHQEEVKMQSGVVTARILHVLYKDQIQHLKSLNIWPTNFTASQKATKLVQPPDYSLAKSGSDDSGAEDEFVNPNHVQMESSGEEEDEYSF